MGERVRNAAMLLVPMAIAVLAHAWSLNEPFLAEDFARQARIHDQADSQFSWLPSLADFQGMSFFRPLIELSFGLDFWLWGTSTTGYHVTNLVLFAAVCGLTTALSWRLVGDRFVAGVAGTLLAVSPVVSEVVVWVTGRGGMIPTIIVLGAALATLTPRRPRFLYLVPTLFLLGLFAKEWVVAFAPVLVVMRIVVTRTPHHLGLREAVRSTALLWPALVVYLLVRALVLGKFIGGYAAGGGLFSQTSRGIVIDRLDYLLALVLQTPETVVGGTARYLLAGAVLLLLAGGLLRIGKVLQAPTRVVVCICTLWIAAVTCIHLPVVIDPVEFADVRHLFPALPAMCMLFAMACAGWRAVRWWAALGLATIFAIGLVSAAEEWREAGRISETIGADARHMAAPEQVRRLELHGVPPTHGRARLGIALEVMFRPPFYPEDGTPVEVHGDLLVAHRGLRRTASFLGLLQAIRARRADTALAYFDRQRSILRPVPDPQAQFEIRGRLLATADKKYSLHCTGLQVEFAEGTTPPGPDQEVRLRGRFVEASESGEPLRFVVESLADSDAPVLSVRRDAAKSSMEMHISGPADSVYMAFAASSAAVQPIPGFGVLLVDADAPVWNGELDATGRSVSAFKIASAATRIPTMQVIVFMSSGEVLTSRCICEN